jgi:hypothetical protein
MIEISSQVTDQTTKGQSFLRIKDQSNYKDSTVKNSYDESKTRSQANKDFLRLCPKCGSTMADSQLFKDVSGNRIWECNEIKKCGHIETVSNQPLEPTLSAPPASS